MVSGGGQVQRIMCPHTRVQSYIGHLEVKPVDKITLFGEIFKECQRIGGNDDLAF